MKNALKKSKQLRENVTQMRRGIAFGLITGVGALALTLVPVGASIGVGAGASASAATSTYMTVQEGAALGLTPGMSYKGSTPSKPVELGSIVSDTASGCNQSVCISVIGTGLLVSDWSTKAYFPNAGEIFAAFWANGSVIATSPSVYTPPGEWWTDDWGHEAYFANGTQLCNNWWGTSGKPCETVHS